MPKEKEDYFNNFWKFSRLILFHKARKINTVELPYSKIGPSPQNVYYKEVFYYKEVSKFPIFRDEYFFSSMIEKEYHFS